MIMNIWAHRGCSGRFPENTLTSFREALKYDITGIELDIQLSKDGRMVVIHDETVDRTTSGEGSVCDMTADELRSLKIDAPDGSTERIPFIEEVLDLMKEPCMERGLMIDIELKNSKVRYEGMEEMILKTVKDFGLEEHVIYSSFCADSVKMLKEFDPSVHVGILEAQASECLRLMEETGADAIHPLVHWIDVWDLTNKVSVPVRAWNLGGSEPLYPSTDEIETVDLGKAKELGITDLITTYPELYAEPVGKKEDLDEILFFEDVFPSFKSGRMKKSKYPVITNREPMRVRAGSKISLKDPFGYEYRLFIYKDEVDPDLMYTYAYSRESNWTIFDREVTQGSWTSKPADIERDCFMRLTVRKKDRTKIPGNYPGPAGHIYSISPADVAESVTVPGFIQEEARRAAARLRSVRKPGDTVLFLLADTHYSTNGNWTDTAASVKLAARSCYPDAIIHLGDLTDGLLPRELTKQFAGRMIRDMKRAGQSVYCCIGNHDTNYFKGNPDVFSPKECAAFYTPYGKADYCIDLPARKTRLIFLDSFDPSGKDQNRRYGFSLKTVIKAARMLKGTPEGHSAVIFSHSPVLGWMHYWSDRIKNESRLLRALERQMRRGHKALCIVHGHNHGDQIAMSDHLPIVSIGCTKLEAVNDKKPGGTVTPDRRPGDASQELWDIMRISEDGSEIDFIRFGAGSDRHLRHINGKWIVK